MGRAAYRVFHAWDVAGVASVLSKTMDRMFGTRSSVLMRKKFDPFGFDEDAIGDGLLLFYLELVMKAKNADIIHVHSAETAFNLMRRLFPKKPIVMHYHGSDIRSRGKPLVKGKPAHIFYATKGLAKYFVPGEATWCPIPVDRNFYRRTGPPRSPNSAVSFNLKRVEETKQIAKKFGLELDVLERKFHWTEIPNILSKYAYYLDIKEDPVTHNVLKEVDYLSTTALQALSMGLKVIAADEKLYTEFPPENDAEAVATMVYNIYSKISEKKEGS